MRRLLCLLLLSSCAAGGPRLAPAPAADAAALDRAVEAFYRAENPAGLRSAVEEARLAGPDSAAYHEIAGVLASLEDRREDALAQFEAALRDEGDPAALLHLRMVLDVEPTTLPARLGEDDLLETVWRQHPDPGVRAASAYLWLRHQWINGREDRGREALAAIPGILPLWMVGAWDNEEGKAFDTPLPPESGVDVAAHYQGARVEIGWRPAVAMPWGSVMPEDHVVPRRAAVAYLASGVEVPSAGSYELRVGSSQPIKIWLDGREILEVPEIKAWSFDGYVVPVELSAGAHQLLVKSAHKSGGWQVWARLTGAGGKAVAVSTSAPHFAGEAARVASPSARDRLRPRLAFLAEGSARRAYHEVAWADEVLGGSETVHRAEEMVAAFPRSVAGRFQLFMALWEEGEKGRAADLLSALDAEAGAELPLIAVKQARMWTQQNLKQKARKKLEAIVAAHPDRAGAYWELTSLYGDEGWREDRCKLIADAVVKWPALDGFWSMLGTCRAQLGIGVDPEEVDQRLLSQRPHDLDRLSSAITKRVDRGQLDEALSLTREYEASRPDLAWGLRQESWILRRMGKPEQSEAALLRAQALDPDDSWIYFDLASIDYVAGRRDRALGRWRAALARDPSNETLSNRLAELAPSGDGAWSADVPDAAAMEAAVKLAQSSHPAPGADLFAALDDEVRSIHADGSVSSVSTSVIRAVTRNGVNGLGHRNLGHGANRLLTAYALDTEGKRIEPSSVSNDAIIFRGLDVGSIVVLQVRSDQAPRPILNSTVEGKWWFEAFSTEVARARFVLWRPSGTTLRETIHGTMKVNRQESVLGKDVRVEYAAHDTPPAIQEESSPPSDELLTVLSFSTLPDWDAMTRWENALLEDSLRPSTEIAAQAKALAGPEVPAHEKLDRIQSFLMQKIRYQQDYENPIAGWKPHPTAMVLERKYGDCKDKTNLFIMLARELGIDARFALVRTRNLGPVDAEVPSLQFNHAIAYVPAQPGVPEARFYDPTADSLDTDDVPQMDQGTSSLVYDSGAAKGTWVPIPLRPAEHGSLGIEAQLSMAPDGSGHGTLIVKAHGDLAAGFRMGARNPQAFDKALRKMVAFLLPGGTITGAARLKVEAAHDPAVVEMDVEVPHLARLEGKELRLYDPILAAHLRTPSLAERRFPLLYGVPDGVSVSLRIDPPAGSSVKEMPPALKDSDSCTEVSRKVRRDGNQLVLESRLLQRCEQVSAAAYPAYRGFLEKMSQAARDPLVLAPGHKR